MSRVPPNDPGREAADGRQPDAGGHQPVNPSDLRRVPPGSAGCAQVRDLLRDFADGDLATEPMTLVETHVHGCRECAVELVRAEHEVLRLRRAFSGVPVAAPSPGFAAAVVDRLLLDLVRSHDVASTTRSEPAPGSALGESGVWRRADVRPAGPRAGVAFAALALLATVVVLVLSAAETVAEVDLRQRVIVTSATNSFERGEPVQSGSLPTDTQVSVVGGELLAEMHDSTTLSQPAAQVRLSGDGQIRVIDGRPTLVSGSLEVNAHRPVSIEVADKTRVELGAGRYLIEAGQFEVDPDGLPPVDDPFGDTAYRVVVRSGDDAAIVRDGAESVVLAVGSLGVWKGASAVKVTTFAGEVASGGGLTRTRAETGPASPAVIGNVFCSDGTYAAGASVLLRFLEHGSPQSLTVTADAGGAYALPPGRVLDRDFLVVQAVPPVDQPNWSLLPPRAVLLTSGPDCCRIPALIFDETPALGGSVVGTNGRARHGVTVIPCVLDPVFGQVLPWVAGAVSTDQQGRFLMPRLPNALAPLQELALLFVHPSHAVRLVPIPLPRSAAFGPFAASLRVVLNDAREVQIRGLPAGVSVELYEALGDLPVTMGRRPIQPPSTTAQGMTWLQSGGGQLWLRTGSAARPQLRALVAAPLVPGVEPPSAGHLLVPSQTLVRDFDAIFAATPVRVWNFEFASQFRDEFLASPARGDRVSILAGDERSGHPVAGTCLYALGEAGRGRKTVRLLGIHGPRDPLETAVERGEHSVVGIAVDGGFGLVSLGTGSRPDRLQVSLRAPGAVQLGATARPANMQYDGVAVLRFVPRAGHVLAGTSAVVTRFASSRNNFEVDRVPPGDYTLTVGDRAFEITVPAGGIIELR